MAFMLTELQKLFQHKPVEETNFGSGIFFTSYRCHYTTDVEKYGHI